MIGRLRGLWVPAACLCVLLIATGCAAAPERETPTVTTAADAAARVPLVNPGFESEKSASHGGPEGWSATQHAGDPSYRFTLDAGTRRSGSRSLRIDNIGNQPFGALEQSLPIASAAGRKLRFSAWLKTRDANDGGAALVMLAEGGGGAIVAHNFMGGSEVTGSREWQRYSIELTIPEHATALRVGVMLRGAGTVWFDDAELDVVRS